MTKTQVRQKIHQYIDEANDDVLKIVHLILEREHELAGYALTSAEKKALDKERRLYLSGKGKNYSLDEVNTSLKKKTRK